MKPSLLALSIVLVSSFAPTHAIGLEPAATVDAGYVVNLGAKSYLHGMAIYPGGKLLIHGGFSTINGVPCDRFVLVRLNADGTVDPTFKFQGLRSVSAMAVLPNGKIMVRVRSNDPEKMEAIIARLNANGTLDSSFTETPGPDGKILCTALQLDGKLLMGGKFTKVGEAARTNIARFNADGTLDAEFNTSTDEEVNAIAVQPDGRILIGGRFTNVNGMDRKFVARLSPKGTLEGSEAFRIGTGPDNPVSVIALQSDAKILLSGRFKAVNGARRYHLARLDTNGTVENSFNPPFSPFPPSNDGSGPTVSLALQVDGKIIVGAYGTHRALSKTLEVLTRLGGNGAQESKEKFAPRFGPDTKAAFKDCGQFDELTVPAVALQSDGKIVFGPEHMSAPDPRNNRTIFTHVLRLSNEPAQETLTAGNASNAYWMRAGTAPEVSFATFEVSADDGVTWSPLGFGTRIRGGWQCAGLSLPAHGLLRARGSVPGSFRNGAQGLVEKVAPFNLAGPIRKP